MTVKGRIVSHPGIYIKDAIEELGLSQSEFAFRTGLSVKTVSTLINGESNITFDVAIKLASFFHNNIDGWINLQTKYNLFLNEEKKNTEYTKDWEIAKQFDKEFVTNFLHIQIDKSNKETTINELRKCFNVTLLQNLKYEDLYAFHKTSTNKNLNEKTIIMRNAWISLAEQEARKMVCSPFNKERILAHTNYLRSLTLEKPEIMSKKLKEFLLECGVKLVILPFLRGSNTNGVTKWIPNEDCVMIAVNDCGKDADKIWFSIFHEIGHAIKNHKRHPTISYDKNKILDSEEREANEFAKNSLINKQDFENYVKSNDFSIASIKKFAKSQNVAPFIVIGRLQKEELIGWERYQSYKPKYAITF